MFELIENGRLKYYVIPSFAKTGMVRHGFTTIHGGVSEGCYYSMNLRSNSDDDWENVLENFRIISEELGIERDALVLSKQVHEDVVHTVEDCDIGNGILFKNKLDSADALITDKKRVPIAVFSADCVPLFFLDKRQGVIALAHSGWRGTVKRIAQKTAEKMKRDYGSLPEDILAAIGPSVQEEHFEVGDDVAELFIAEFGNDTAVKYGEKYHVNMQKAIEMQLREAEIPQENIDNCGICTVCSEGMLYSHRRMGNERGNMGAFLELI